MEYDYYVRSTRCTRITDFRKKVSYTIKKKKKQTPDFLALFIFHRHYFSMEKHDSPYCWFMCMSLEIILYYNITMILWLDSSNNIEV